MSKIPGYWRSGGGDQWVRIDNLTIVLSARDATQKFSSQQDMDESTLTPCWSVYGLKPAESAPGMYGSSGPSQVLLTLIAPTDLLTVIRRVDREFPPPSWVKVESPEGLEAPSDIVEPRPVRVLGIRPVHRVAVAIDYDEGVLIPGGIQRDQPSTVEELVEEIDRQMNASHFGGCISLSILKESKRTA